MKIFLVLEAQQLQRGDERQSVVKSVAQSGVESSRALSVGEVYVEDLALVAVVAMSTMDLENAFPKIVVEILLKDVFALLIEVIQRYLAEDALVDSSH